MDPDKQKLGSGARGLCGELRAGREELRSIWKGCFYALDSRSIIKEGKSPFTNTVMSVIIENAIILAILGTQSKMIYNINWLQYVR